MKVKSFALSLACAFSFSAASVMADPVWTGEALYRGSEPALATDNLLRTVGVTYSIKDNEGHWGAPTLSDDRCLSNGSLDWNTDGTQNKSCIIGDKAKLEVSFPRAADVSAIKIYGCSGNGGRDGIHVASISVKRTADGEWETLTSISDYSIGLNDNSSAGAYFVSLTDTTGKIAEGVYALLIDFGTMDNNGTFMDEIEVCGTLTEASSFHVVFLDRDGTTELKAVDLNPGESVTAPDVPTHEGWTFLGWDKDFSVVNGNLTIRSLWAEAGKPLWTTGTWADGVVPASYNREMLSWNRSLRNRDFGSA